MAGLARTTRRAQSVFGIGAVTAIVALAIAGCGGSSGGDTTIIEKSAPQPQTVTQVTTTTTAAPTSNGGGSSPGSSSPPAPEPSPPQSSPPDVTGLTLPTAKRQLSDAGFKADVKNTDTMFGIMVPEHYTVCKQSDPRGDVVPILAQKYGC